MAVAWNRLSAGYLRLSGTVGNYAADIGSSWPIIDCSPEGFIQKGEIRYFPFDGTRYFSTESVKDGATLTEYTFKDNTFSYELKRVYGLVFVQEIVKLSDDIYLALVYNKAQPDEVLDPETFIFSNVLIKCPETFAEGTDGKKDVEAYLNRVKQDLIPQIP